MNRLVRQAIKLIPKEQEDIQQAKNLIGETTNAVLEREDQLLAKLTSTQQKLGALGGWAKAMLIGPCYAILAVVFGLLMAPVLFVWYFFM